MFYKNRKTDLKDLFLISLLFMFTQCVFGPMEMFLTNREEFWFGLKHFWHFTLIASLAVMIIILFIGMFIRGKLFKLYLGGVFGAGIAIYAQGNFLNLKVGVMNGVMIDWTPYRANFYGNLFFWIACILLFMVLFYFKEDLARKAGSALSVMGMLVQLVTLVILFVTTANPIGDDNPMFVSDKGMYEVGKENVIVFLLDMYEDRYFETLLAENKELGEMLDGFTYFSNSVGAYSTTSYSAAKLLTGQYLYNQEPFADQLNTAYGDSVLIPTLQEGGYHTYLYVEENKFASDGWPIIQNYLESDTNVTDQMQFFKKLYRLVACKYWPNIVKPFLWMEGNRFDELRVIASKEGEMYTYENGAYIDRMKEHGISLTQEDKCFKFIHLDGVHYPYRVNENAEILEGQYTDPLRCAMGNMKMMQWYLEDLKELGVYDDTAIIILGDHGYYWEGCLTNPLLLVKPKGSRGELQMTHAPVSQDDFVASVLSLAGLNENGEYGRSFMEIEEGEERERLFYQYYLNEGHEDWNFRLIEYSVDSADNARENFHLTDVEYSKTGEKISHKDNCAYCLAGNVDPLETPENAPLLIVHESK